MSLFIQYANRNDTRCLQEMILQETHVFETIGRRSPSLRLKNRAFEYGNERIVSIACAWGCRWRENDRGWLEKHENLWAHNESKPNEGLWDCQKTVEWTEPGLRSPRRCCDATLMRREKGQFLITMKWENDILYLRASFWRWTHGQAPRLTKLFPPSFGLMLVPSWKSESETVKKLVDFRMFTTHPMWQVVEENVGDWSVIVDRTCRSEDVATRIVSDTVKAGDNGRRIHRHQKKCETDNVWVGPGRCSIASIERSDEISIGVDNDEMILIEVVGTNTRTVRDHHHRPDMHRRWSMCVVEGTLQSEDDLQYRDNEDYWSW